VFQLLRLIVGIQVKYPHKVVDLSCADSMADIAESLDVDAPTQATCNEFCGGMVQITCCSEALDIVRVMTMLMFARQETRSVTHRCTATVAPPRWTRRTQSQCRREGGNSPARQCVPRRPPRWCRVAPLPCSQPQITADHSRPPVFYLKFTPYLTSTFHLTCMVHMHVSHPRFTPMLQISMVSGPLAMGH